MLSILIFTKNRQDDLRELINSVKSQNIDIDHEIIIINNGENNIIFENNFKFFHYKTNLKRLSEIFNFGWKKCNFQNILFLADDVVLNEDWFSNAKKYILNKNYNLLGGPILSSSYPAGLMHDLYVKAKRSFFTNLFLKFFMYFSFDKDPFLPGMICKSGSYTFGASLENSKNLGLIDVDLLTTSTMLVKREILNQINGFSELYNFNHADGDLFLRAKYKGFRIQFDSNLISFHKVRLGPSRSPYHISRDTIVFYIQHVRPDSIRAFIGLILNLMSIFLIYTKQSIQNFNLDAFKCLAGYIYGVSYMLKFYLLKK